METFAKLFGSLLVFVYHCFDRIVINGYLSGLSRPEQVVYFFRQVLGIPVVSKEILSQRTNDYRDWVDAYARNHKPARDEPQKQYWPVYLPFVRRKGEPRSLKGRGVTSTSLHFDGKPTR